MTDLALPTPISLQILQFVAAIFRTDLFNAADPAELFDFSVGLDVSDDDSDDTDDEDDSDDDSDDGGPSA